MTTKKELYSYKDGKREGVIFAFYNPTTNKILLEIRDTEKKDIFFTNGSIEEKDKINSTSTFDYRMTALLREINEEFSNQVFPNTKHIHYVNELYVNEINVVFYIYLVNMWSGKFPDYTVEDGKKFAELIWVKVDEAYTRIPFESGKRILEMIEHSLKIWIC